MARRSLHQFSIAALIAAMLALPSYARAQQALTPAALIAQSASRTSSYAPFKTLLLSSKASSYDASSYVQVFSGYGPENFQQLIPLFKAARGKSNERDTVFLDHPAGGQWVLFNVYNRSQAKSRWVLKFGNHAAGTVGLPDHILIYTDADATSPVINDGRLAKNKQQAAEQSDNAVPLTFEPGQNRIVGIYIQPTAGLPLSLHLSLEEQMVYAEAQDNKPMEDRAVIALVLALAVMMLAYRGGYRKPISLMLAAYLLSQFFIYRTADQIVSEGHDMAAEHIALLYALSAFAGLGLLQHVIVGRDDDLKSRLLVLGGKVVILILALVAFVGLAGAEGAQGILVRVFTPLLPIVGVAISAVSFRRHGGWHRILFAASWLLLALGAMVSEAVASGVLPFSAAGLNAYWYCLGPHAAILFFSSLYHQRLTEDNERRAIERAQEKQEAEQELRKTREIADQTRLLGVMQREKELMADLRKREADRIQALRQSKEVADQANKAKSDFLAVISHEIRTPMTGIMGMIRLLMDTSMDVQQKEYVETIQYSGETLLTLLNDILDLSKAEEGKMSLESLDFDLGKLVNSVAMLMSGRANEKKIELKTKISPDTPMLLKGDPTRLRQILLNLVSNAIKFTTEGAVTITIKPHESMAKRPRIYFAVSDTGIGITEDVQKKLFTPYAQADATISRTFGGTGLGLAICKRLVEAMGSTIQIHSDKGQGTTFYFILSLDHGAAPETRTPVLEASSPATDPLKILVVDDNSINQRVVAGFLEKDRHRVTTASSGSEAVALVEERHFDVVLMDVEMPGMDGLTATRTIRGMQNPIKAHLPIIAMTAHAGREDVVRCRDAGMNDHVAKPISFDNLRRALSAVTRHEDDKAATPAPVPVTTTEETSDLFNTEVLGSLKSGLGKAQMAEMMDGLYQKTEELIGALETAVAANDAKAIIGRSHDIKGMTANFGLMAISRAAAQIERLAKDSADADKIAPIAKTLRPLYYDTRTAVDKWMK